MNKHLLVLSGGVGKRYGADIPKQYTRDSENNMIITLSLLPFIDKGFKTVTFVANKKYWKTIEKEINYLFPKVSILFVDGGAERQDSINNGINKLVEHLGRITKNDHVFIQEAVRPFVTPKLVDDLINADETLNNVTPAINPPVLYGISNGKDKTISELIPKKQLLELQLPKRYSLKDLNTLISKDNYDSKTLLDESELFLKAGQKINIIEGSTFNVKITFPEHKITLNKK